MAQPQGTSISPDQIQRYELTEVYSHPEAVVDIVLVHGLNGHPQKTWTAKNGVFWPTQLLPVSLRGAKARVLVYGYNADVYTFGSSTGNANSEMIHQHARTLVSHLALWRQSEDATENPIIWVAHSLGGILVKRV
jgi:alpha-beta hydrolase superfamily lysophospholipase